MDGRNDHYVYYRYVSPRGETFVADDIGDLCLGVAEQGGSEADIVRVDRHPDGRDIRGSDRVIGRVTLTVA